MCTVDLARKLDLPMIAKRINNAEYNPNRYNPVVLRIKKPKSTANVFASGKIVCTGTRSKAVSYTHLTLPTIYSV